MFGNTDACQNKPSERVAEIETYLIDLYLAAVTTTLLPFLFFLPSCVSLALAREAQAAVGKNQTVKGCDTQPSGVVPI